MDVLQTMKSLVVVAETGSFTAAAERRRTTTQMVSKHVKAFEDRMGVRVFDRTTRRVRATDLGRAVIDRCRQILDAVDELEASVQDRQRAPKGRIRVAAPLTFGEMHIAPRLSEFRAMYPEVEVSLLLTDRYVNLIEEGVDTAVRIGRLDDSSLVARKLAETELVCVASPAYLAAEGTPNEPSALQSHRIIQDDNFRDGGRWPFFEEGRLRRIEVKSALSVNSARAVHDLAVAGAGVALLPRFAAAGSLHRGTLKRVLEDFASAPFPIHLLFPHAHFLTARVRSFADYLSSALKAADL